MRQIRIKLMARIYIGIGIGMFPTSVLIYIDTGRLAEIGLVYVGQIKD